MLIQNPESGNPLAMFGKEVLSDLAASISGT
jgi:hypothetical protein